MSAGISIVVPTFERTDLLLETVASVEAQTSAAWECLIVDDGSSDEHIHTIKNRICHDSRFQLVRTSESNRGAPACRNIGWRAANFDLIVFLDSDDLLTSDCVASRLQYVSQHPASDFWVFSTLLFDLVPGDRDVLLNVMTVEDPVSRFLKMDVIWLTTGVLWKKETLTRLGGWDDSLLSWQDWDLSLRALLSGLRFRYEARIDNYFRIQSDSRSSIGLNSYSPAHLESHHRLVDRVSKDVSKRPDHLALACQLNFWIAVQWLGHGNLLRAMSTWATSKGRVPFLAYFRNHFALVILRIPVLGNRLAKYLERRNHPAFQLWKGTYKRVKAPYVAR